VRNRIVGIVGIVLGGVIVLRFNFMNDPAPESAMDELVIGLFGAVMFLAGLHAVFKESGS